MAQPPCSAETPRICNAIAVAKRFRLQGKASLVYVNDEEALEMDFAPEPD